MGHNTKGDLDRHTFGAIVGACKDEILLGNMEGDATDVGEDGRHKRSGNTTWSIRWTNGTML